MLWAKKAVALWKLRILLCFFFVLLFKKYCTKVIAFFVLNCMINYTSLLLFFPAQNLFLAPIFFSVELVLFLAISKLVERFPKRILFDNNCKFNHWGSNIPRPDIVACQPYVPIPSGTSCGLPSVHGTEATRSVCGLVHPHPYSAHSHPLTP